MTDKSLESRSDLPEKAPQPKEASVTHIVEDNRQRMEGTIEGIPVREYAALMREKFESPGSGILDSEMRAFLRALIETEQGKEASAYSLDTFNADSIDTWQEAGKPDFFTHVLTEAARPNAPWAHAIEGQQLLAFQQKALLHLSRRLRKTGNVKDALAAIERRKIILQHIPNAERETAMVAWEMAILRRDNQKDFPGARNDFDESVQFAKKGNDKVGAIFNEFNLRQMEIVEAEAGKTEGIPVDEDLIDVTFEAIASLRDMMQKAGAAEPKRFAALVPNMITELAKAQTLLGNGELAMAFVEELKTQERVKKSLEESGETIWKKIIADLERGISEIA